MATIPELLIHSFNTGATPNNTLPNGTETPDLGGRVVRYLTCTAGGKIAVPVATVQPCGLKLTNISWNFPGATLVKLFIVDPVTSISIEMMRSTQPTGSFIDLLNSSILLPPGWSAYVLSNNALSGAGELIYFCGRGWEHNPFSSIVING